MVDFVPHCDKSSRPKMSSNRKNRVVHRHRLLHPDRPYNEWPGRVAMLPLVTAVPNRSLVVAIFVVVVVVVVHWSSSSTSMMLAVVDASDTIDPFPDIYKNHQYHFP